MESKQLLRKKILSLRKNSKDLSLTLENEIIVKKTQEVIESIILNKNKHIILSNKADILDNMNIIGLYWPMKGEVDLSKLAIKFSTKVALPKLKGSRMYFVKYDLDSAMERSEFSKLMQPQNENKVEPSIIVIPSLSLSLHGDRLGFGAGYYDKYIEKATLTKNAIKIGICFHQDLNEYLPRESHDLVLDYVITDKTIIKL
jgi:5-formyltetrahydrofolate cyclo-ligase